MSEQRLFAIAACALGIAFLAITPPFKVPDERAHFWRAEAIAAGHLIPNGGGRPDSANIPQGLKTLVWVIEGNRDFRTAYAIPLEPIKEPRIEFPAWYTPLPYVPQAIAAAVCRLLNVRPLITFYAGRLATLAAALALIAAAMRVAPALSSIIGAVALLPMTIFLFASWSADAMTIALSILLTAMLLSDRNVPLPALTGVTLALALCKPAYFLIPAMIFLASKSWIAIGSVIGADIAGTVASFGYARMAYYRQRPGLPVDAAAQLRCMAADPMRFARAGLHDALAHGASYVEEMIGRLGSMDVKLPVAVIVVELLLLIVVAAGSGIGLSAGRRTLAMVIVILTAAGIVLSQVLTWSIVCSDVIEGVQGRYFLPVVPLALAAISIPQNRWRFAIPAVVAIASVCDAVALVVLWRIYW